MDEVKETKEQVTDMRAPDTNKTDMRVAAPEPCTCAEGEIAVCPPPALEPWQERMAKEYCELKERYCKLHRIITRIEAGTCDFNPACPLELLQRQACAMGEYLHVLELRAEIEKVPLPY
jgi:hypothetical protein